MSRVLGVCCVLGLALSASDAAACGMKMAGGGTVRIVGVLESLRGPTVAPVTEGIAVVRTVVPIDSAVAGPPVVEAPPAVVSPQPTS